MQLVHKEKMKDLSTYFVSSQQLEVLVYSSSRTMALTSFWIDELNYFSKLLL